MKKSLLFLIPLLLLACTPEEEQLRLRLVVDGNVSTALIQYAQGNEWSSLPGAELPWILELEVAEGTPLHLYARTEDTEAYLVALMYHEDATVGQAQSCLCGGDYVSVELLLSEEDWPLQEF